MRLESEKRWISAVVGVVLLGAIWVGPGATVAQGEPCEGVVEIDNGGFELPDLPPGGSREVSPDGWTSSGSVVVWGEGSHPAHSTQFASVSRNASLSQTVHQPELAGATVTITFAASGEPSSLIVRFGTHDRRFLVEPGFATYSLSVPVSVGDPGPYILAFEGARPNAVDVDDVAFAYAKPCPTPIPTNTPTMVPAAEVEITVTGDPRYPVCGSVALDVPGLSYTLGKKSVGGQLPSRRMAPSCTPRHHDRRCSTNSSWLRPTIRSLLSIWSCKSIRRCRRSGTRIQGASQRRFRMKIPAPAATRRNPDHQPGKPSTYHLIEGFLCEPDRIGSAQNCAGRRGQPDCANLSMRNNRDFPNVGSVI